MADVVHSEQAGEWVGHVWRRKETPDQITQYYWSLSFTGDMREVLQKQAEQEDGTASQSPVVPDSCFYYTQDAAQQKLQEEMKRQGLGR
jgi:hypothetical protein